MDPGRLPAYRSSYLLRFHPYPRVKPLARERILASCRESGVSQPMQVDLHPYLEHDASFYLDQAIHGTDAHNKPQLRQRRLSMSTLIIDLALLFAKKLSLHDGESELRNCSANQEVVASHEENELTPSFDA